MAKPGQTIEVSGGKSVAQTIEPDGGKSSSERVTFRPVAGATATVADLDIRGASNITFAGSGVSAGFVFGRWNARIGTRNITFERINTGGFNITLPQGSPSSADRLGRTTRATTRRSIRVTM